MVKHFLKTTVNILSQCWTLTKGTGQSLDFATDCNIHVYQSETRASWSLLKKSQFQPFYKPWLPDTSWNLFISGFMLNIYCQGDGTKHTVHCTCICNIDTYGSQRGKLLGGVYMRKLAPMCDYANLDWQHLCMRYTFQYTGRPILYRDEWLSSFTRYCPEILHWKSERKSRCGAAIGVNLTWHFLLVSCTRLQSHKRKPCLGELVPVWKLPRYHVNTPLVACNRILLWDPSVEYQYLTQSEDMVIKLICATGEAIA